MKRNELEKLGLEKEAIDSIMALNGKDIEAFKAESATATAERDGLKGQLDEAGAAIEGFKKLDVDGIKAAADEWKTKYDKATADSAAQLSALKFDHALDGALTGAKAKNAKAVRALLQSDALKLQEDGSIMGLKEQLETIKADNDYLFDSDIPAPKIVSGGGNKPIEIQDAVVIAARAAAGLPPNK